MNEETPFSTQGHSAWMDKRKRIIGLHRFCQTDNGELMYEGETYLADTFRVCLDL